MCKSIALALLGSVVLGSSAFAQSCSGATYTTLTNGMTADATQVMGNFSCVLTRPAFAGPVGIGMTPTNILDITQNQNGSSLAKISNNNSGSLSESLFETSNGTHSVGIGMAGTGFGSTSFEIADGGYLIANGNGGLVIGTNVSQPTRFWSNTSEVARFDSSGNLDINSQTTGGWTGAARLSVQSIGSGTVGAFSAHNSSSTGSGWAIDARVDSTANALVQFNYNGSTIVGSITTSGTGITLNTTSDERLKSDRGILAAVPELMELRVHRFVWQSTKKPDVGLFAQEAYEVLPNIIKKGGTDPHNSPWQIDYLGLIPRLLVGWQAHERRLGSLEEELKELKAANDNHVAEIESLKGELSALERKTRLRTAQK